MNHPVHMVDWMPTFASLLDLKPTEEPHWDGKDIWSLLNNETSTIPDRPLYWNLRHNEFAARLGDWKLISKDDQEELYNVASDPGETCDCAQEQPGIVKDLRKIIAEHHEECVLRSRKMESSSGTSRLSFQPCQPRQGE